MGKARLAGHADEAELLAGRDLLARADLHAALAHMAVLGLPALAVLDRHAVAAIAALDRRLADHRDADVVHAVADVADPARRRRQHRHALPHRSEARDREIRP